MAALAPRGWSLPRVCALVVGNMTGVFCLLYPLTTGFCVEELKQGQQTCRGMPVRGVHKQ